LFWPLKKMVTMAEQLRLRPDSEEERVLWFASLAPNRSNLNFENFKVGLQATEEIVTTIQELIEQAYYSHGLDNASLLPGGPDFRDTVTETTTALLTIFQNAPTHWMNDWCEALILDIWSKNRSKKEEIREGKKPEPALADSPTIGRDVPRISEPPPLHTAPTTPSEEKKQGPLPIDQRTFALEVISSDKIKLRLLPPEILEIISVRCVPEGKDPALVRNYQLNLFVDEFEEVLNAVSGDEPYKLANGKLVYFSRPTNQTLRAGRGTQHMIENQKQFEVAVTHLLHNTNGDNLTFTFFEENSHQKRKRMGVEKKAAEAAQIKKESEAKKAELFNQKQKQEQERAQHARNQREATRVKVLARSKAQAPPLPQRSAGSKPDENNIEVGESSNTSVQNPVQDQTHFSFNTTPQPSLASASSFFANGMKTDKENSGKEQVRVPQNGRKSKIRVKPLDPSPASLAEPVAKSTPPRKPRPGVYRDSVPLKAIPTPPYLPSSSVSTIDKEPRKPEFDSLLFPRASTPPTLRRKRAIINAVVTTVNAGKKINATMTGTPTHPEKAALFAPDPNRKRREREEKLEGRDSITSRQSQEQANIRRESGFYPQSPSPAIKRRESVASRVNTRASMSLRPISAIKNVFRRESKDVAPVQDQVGTSEDYYAEVSRRTFVRGGENEQDLSIERLKEIGNIERLEDTEVEEQPDDFENPDEFLVTR
jgi:hypothetical protein